MGIEGQKINSISNTGSFTAANPTAVLTTPRKLVIKDIKDTKPPKIHGFNIFDLPQ